MERAWSQFTVKSINDETRVIEGIASTRTTDRVGDIVEPMWANVSLPLPFLMHHGTKSPVGHVVRAKPNKEGIPVRVEFKQTDVPGGVKDRLDDAWQDVKLGL